MEKTVIREARMKTALFCGLCLGFVAIFVFVPNARDDWRGLLGLVFFGLGVLIFGWRLIRPGTLTLDGDGFTVVDLFGRERRTAWRSVTPFFLMKLSRGGNLIAYNYVPGQEPKAALLKVSRALGADAGIAGIWPGSKADMVARLNDYRTRALAASTAPPA